jgi:hypothetical protein
MRVELAILAAGLLALASPACAQTGSNGQPGAAKPHHGKNSKRHFGTQPDKAAKPRSDDWWSATRSAPARHKEDCPNGDCRGLNSPNGFGGSGSDF